MARKNDVFTSSSNDKRQNSPLPEGVMRQDVMKEFGWEIPVDVAPLPSAGVIYPANSSLHGRDKVEIKAMTAKEEDIIMSKAYSKLGTTITELIRSCLIDKSIDPNLMLVGDRQALLVAIRITGYGADYRCEVDCGDCGKRGTDVFDLSSLEIEPLKVDPTVPGLNEFDVILPVSKKKVTLKFLTGRDEEELSIEVERRKKLLGDAAENPITTRMQHQIIRIDNITDRNKIASFVVNMPARDSKFLREFYANNEPGIKMKSRYSCSHCGAESEVNLPMGASFFWPTD